MLTVIKHNLKHSPWLCITVRILEGRLVYRARSESTRFRATKSYRRMRVRHALALVELITWYRKPRETVARQGQRPQSAYKGHDVMDMQSTMPFNVENAIANVS